MENINAGHRKRLRERFIKSKADGFSEHELLELLLSYSIPRKDLKPLAKALIYKFNSLAGVLDAEIEELCNVKGIGQVSAVLIKLVKELKTEYHIEEAKNDISFSSPETVYNFVREKLAGSRDEKFLIIYLNTKNKIISHEISAEGTVTRAAVYPRKIIRKTLELNASAIILAHNHPSGEIEPSKQDIELTNSINKVCQPMDIRLLDHLIIGSNTYMSFTRENLIK